MRAYFPVNYQVTRRKILKLQEEREAGTDADADFPGEANPAPPEPKPARPRKSAPESDSGILDKFDSDNSDED